LSTIKHIPFAKVVCDGNELTYITEVLESGWLTTAAKCVELETKFVDKVGGTYACAVNSCTAALHLACEAAGIGTGDKVFVPTMTFTASAEIVRYLGADPVFLDVEYGSCLVTPEILKMAINRNPNVGALIMVHFGGQAAEMDSIMSLCREHGLKLIEDAAHAFPTRYHDRMIGSFGDATCFSFYANKTITAGEGGMLVTDNKELFARAKVMRLHGINRDIWYRFTAEKANWEYDVVAPGYKYNLPDVAAAIGLAQLERADVYRTERERCARFYFDRLGCLDCLDLPLLHVPMEDHSWHLFHVILKDNAPVGRNRFIELMAEKGVGTSVHYKPLHRMTYYRERYWLRSEDYPDAERIWKGCVSLPIYPSLSEDDLDYICSTIITILK